MLLGLPVLIRRVLGVLALVLAPVLAVLVTRDLSQVCLPGGGAAGTLNRVVALMHEVSRCPEGTVGASPQTLALASGVVLTMTLALAANLLGIVVLDAIGTLVRRAARALVAWVRRPATPAPAPTGRLAPAAATRPAPHPRAGAAVPWRRGPPLLAA